MVKLPQLRDGFTAAFQVATRQDLVNHMLRAPKGSERPEICDVAHSELDMIGHLRCEWIRFRLFDMNRHSESI